ncbi:MAG TPA: hypothetical protein VMJ10_37605 [Kofleriaceae bacterium]|nr:hypothetical protein [Kofleriaceae bacterium]
MDDLIEAIRTAVATDATPEARAAGARACRALLSAFEPSEVAPPAEVAVPSPPIATLVSAVRGMPAEQVMDLLIAKLRTMVPADAQPAASRALNIMRVPVPTL